NSRPRRDTAASPPDTSTRRQALCLAAGGFFVARRDAGTKGSGMFLTLLRLLPLLALTEADSAGDADSAADTSEPDTGREPASQQSTDGREPSKPEPSANKLIKDFVKQQGITVEDL